MKAVDLIFLGVVILPVFVLFFSKIAYTLWFVAGVFNDAFNLFTYFGVDCKLVATFSSFFVVYFLWMVILFIYNKLNI